LGRRELQLAFDIIPVIDLKDGKAVRAVSGERAAYLPLATALCPDGEPFTAVRGFLALHPFARLYVADLDAIEGRARQDAALQAIRRAFPELELWIDAGFADTSDLTGWLAQGLGRPVLGSESLRDLDLPRRAHGILSLDFHGDRFLGDSALLATPVLWPDGVIVMCLHSVGTGGGPDLTRLKAILAVAEDRQIYAAGGIRGARDLEQLAERGVRGALVASALHSGVITSRDLSTLNSSAPKRS
jgi:phosphoribosylformimino-5-aminoimidazole carboxamide ribotide isomerase